jgi:uncharacterized protein (TIGR02594 family)
MARRALAAAMPKIVISYRRADSEAIAGRIRERLARRYGDTSVYMDIQSIPVAADFRNDINQALREASVMVAIIGPKWLGRRKGRPARIHDADDPIRLEMEAALQKEIPVVPVLVGGASMANAAELPEAIKPLSFRNAVSVDAGRDFDHHVARLLAGLDSILVPKGRRPSLWLLAAAGGAAALVGAVWILAAGLPLPLRQLPSTAPQKLQEIPDAIQIASGQHAPWLSIAHKEVEQTEIDGPLKNPRIMEYISSLDLKDISAIQDDEFDWASAFVEWSLNQAGIRGPKSAAPAGWINWGRQITEPVVGCIVVFSFGKFDHVAFYVSGDAQFINVLGGNQSDMVKVSRYPKIHVLGYRMPP